MVRAVGENSLDSKIGFKTRYGLVSNLHSSKADGIADAETLSDFVATNTTESSESITSSDYSETLLEEWGEISKAFISF